jgi:hypothetical protein
VFGALFWVFAYPDLQKLVCTLKPKPKKLHRSASESNLIGFVTMHLFNRKRDLNSDRFRQTIPDKQLSSQISACEIGELRFV